MNHDPLRSMLKMQRLHGIKARVRARIDQAERARAREAAISSLEALGELAEALRKKLGRHVTLAPVNDFGQGGDDILPEPTPDPPSKLN